MNNAYSLCAYKLSGKAYNNPQQSLPLVAGAAKTLRLFGRPCAVLNEQRGTCSSKHGLLAALAYDCGHPEVELVVGLYAMSEQNTPGVGAVLEPAGVDAIPEAHCYLRALDRRYDFTGLSSGSSSPFEALLSEHVVFPVDLSEKKGLLHQEAIRKWAELRVLPFEEAWALREACIEALASNNTLKPTDSSADAPEPAA